MDELRFDGKVAVVTGAGTGLGRSHALELARRGAQVVVADLGCGTDGTGADPALAEGVAAEIGAAGGQAVACAVDLGDPAGGAATVQTAVDSFGGLDIVVSSAGIVTFPPLDESPPDDVALHLRVDPIGSLNVIRPAWPYLRERRGRILLTVSSALFGIPVGLGYGLAKGGTLALGRACHFAGAKFGIQANMIAPYGFTRMMTAFNRPSASVSAKRELLPVESVSALVAYLVHESCDVSGELFGVGGGRITRVYYAETPGMTKPGLTAEDVRDGIDRIMDLQRSVVVGSNRQFVDRFYDHVPGFRELEARG